MRVLIIVNSRAGGGDAGLYDFMRALGHQGAEVVLRFSDEDHPLDGLAHDADQFDRIVAAGGDGTLSTVCYEVRGSGVPILAYPSGTANLLAQNLGLPPDALTLADVTLNGTAVDFDLGELEREEHEDHRRTGFVLMAGAGFDADIMRMAQPMKSTLGAAAYLLAAVSNLAPTVAKFELVLDGERIHTDGIAVLLLNFGRIQFDLAVTPAWDPRDGRMDVVVVRSRNVAGLIPVVFAAMLDRVGNYPDRTPSVDIYSAREIQVSAYPPLQMQADGDTLEALSPFAARVLPKATTLLVPNDSSYAKESPAPADESA